MSDCTSCGKSDLTTGPTKTSLKIVELLQNQVPFVQSNLFAAKEPVVLSRAGGEEVLPKLVISSEALASVWNLAPETLTLNVPGPNGENLKLLLTKVQIYVPEAIVPDEIRGVHYFGVVEGVEGSQVVLNIFREEVTGSIIIDSKIIELVKDTNSSDPNEYVLYRAKMNKPFSCQVKRPEIIRSAGVKSRAVLSKQLRLQLDSMNGNMTDIQTLFASVASIYLNDPDVELVVQLVNPPVIWTNPGTLPFTYSGANSERRRLPIHSCRCCKFRLWNCMVGYIMLCF